MATLRLTPRELTERAGIEFEQHMGELGPLTVAVLQLGSGKQVMLRSDDQCAGQGTLVLLAARHQEAAGAPRGLSQAAGGGWWRELLEDLHVSAAEAEKSPELETGT